MTTEETQPTKNVSGFDATDSPTVVDRWTLRLQIDAGHEEDADMCIEIAGRWCAGGGTSPIDQCIARQMAGMLQMLRTSGNTVDPSTNEELTEVFKDALGL